MLLTLEAQELTVSEICAVLQMPQSSVSRHLKILGDDGWVRARREGTSRRYSAVRQPARSRDQRLWQLLREEIVDTSAADQDRARMEEVLVQRRTKSQEFFSSSAGRWAQLRQEMFGSRFDLLALLALLDPAWTIGDLGCGIGQTATSLAPFVAKVVAVDDSDAMLEAARRRLARFTNVEVRRGRLESLPLEDQSLDAAILGLVLHHVPDPAKVLGEAARALKPEGRLLVVDMLPHDREEYRQEMGHIWLGFETDQLESWMIQTGLQDITIRALPPEQEAKGPNIFAARAQRVAA